MVADGFKKKKTKFGREVFSEMGTDRQQFITYSVRVGSEVVHSLPLLCEILSIELAGFIF